MNATIGIWTLLVGGWVLPDYGATSLAPDISSELEMQMPLPVLPELQREEPLFGGGPESTAGDSDLSRDEAGRPQRPVRRPPAQYGGSPSGAGQRQPSIPTAPTDPLLGDPESPFAPPTAPSAGQSNSPGLRSYGTPLGGSRTGRDSRQRPLAPTYRDSSSNRPPAPPTFSEFAGRSRAQLNSQDRTMASHGTPLGTSRKPFSSYQAPSPISPYMRLYSEDNDFGRIDNYYTLVKPRLDQQRENMRFGGEIGSLQQRSYNQGTAIQQLGRQTDYLQRGATTPQFMNSGSYFGRPGN